MQPTVIYLPRDYPSLSQTFVRNEVFGLRDLGVDVEVVAVRWSLTDNIADGWAGPHSVAERLPWKRSLLDSAYWAARHPTRYARMWRHVVRAPGGGRWQAVRFLPSLARRLQRRDVVACHTHFAFDHAWSTLFLAALLGVPASVTVHAADIYLDTAERVATLRRFDRVVTVCRYNERFLREHGLTSVEISLVPCGVEVPERVDRRPSGTQRLVSVGRLVPKKGFEGLIRAMAAVVARHPQATLAIAGAGELDGHLRQVAADLGVTNAVRFLGAQSHADVLALIQQCDVFVLNCAVPPDGNTDAVPVVIREAMVREVPVVTTTVAGIPETIDEESGWLVAPGDAVALATAICEALANADGSAKRAVLARRRVATDFTVAAAALAQAQALGLRPGPTEP